MAMSLDTFMVEHLYRILILPWDRFRHVILPICVMKSLGAPWSLGVLSGVVTSRRDQTMHRMKT